MTIRRAMLAGHWYPGDADDLREAIAAYFHRVDVNPPEGTVLGIVMPHAGFTYSGQVAAYSASAVKDLASEIVVILSPYHRGHSASLVTTAHTAYSTPLGEVPVAGDLLANIVTRLEGDGFSTVSLENDPEHAIEIELPLLQMALGAFSLIPLMLVDQSFRAACVIADRLVETLAGHSVLLVASSDLSHFYAQKQALEFDQVVLDRFEARDAEGIIRANTEGRGLACGHGAISTVLMATESFGADRASILKHATSGDVSGDYRSVVGYSAGVVLKGETLA